MLKGALLGVGAFWLKTTDSSGEYIAFGQTNPTPPDTTADAPSNVREYWLQADSFLHNIVPSKFDPMMNLTFTAKDTSYRALGFRAYTPNWEKPLDGDDLIGPNTGIPGPVIRAVVGDTVRVHFKNNDTQYQFPHSLHCHGFRYKPDSDGAYIASSPNAPGTNIPFGSSYTYEYQAIESSVGTWVYHDHSVPQKLTAAKAGGDDDDTMNMAGPGTLPEMSAELGMFGLIAITDKNTPPVDREFCLILHDYYADHIPDLTQDLDSFNGFSYLGNTPAFEAKVGDRVRWRVGAIGREYHAFHIHAHRWKSGNKFVDVETLVPASTLTIEFTEDNPGKWLYHCHITDHMMGGMAGYYLVSNK